ALVQHAIVYRLEQRQTITEKAQPCSHAMYRVVRRPAISLSPQSATGLCAMAIQNKVKILLDNVLQLNGRSDSWNDNTSLLGSVPELDSMAVVGIITALEEDFGFSIDDDEIDADVFATLGSLTKFVECKLAA